MTKLKRELKYLLDLLSSNATYLGLSDSSVQDMLKSALRLDSGVEIKSEYLRELTGKRRCRFWDRMPHHPLPNVSSYINTPSEFGIISALFGILRREESGSVKLSNWTNIRANGYVTYHMNFLGHLRDRGRNRQYWKEGFKLMRSPSFQVMAFNYVCSGWYKSVSTREVNHILKGVREIVDEARSEISLRRVYIAKANGNMRPLGVPSKSWRVYLHMLNVLIVWYRTGLDPNQHAYFPGRGVHTAWLALLERMYSENIYEFDLKSFFPSVNLSANAEILVKDLGFPSWLGNWLLTINRSLTRLTDKDLLDESADRNVLLTSDNRPNPNLPPEIRKLIQDLLNCWRGGSPTASQLQFLFESVLPSGWSVYKETGVPQGAATSCGLATVSLQYIWQRLGDSLLMYADDGLCFPKDSLADPDLSDLARGIAKNEEKSGWVKKEGKWCKPLKFLGLKYLPPVGEDGPRLLAATRGGSTVELTVEKMLLIHLLNEKDLIINLRDRERGGVPEGVVDVADESDSSDGGVMFIRDVSFRTRVAELLYSGNQRSRPPSSRDLRKLIPSSSLADLEGEMKKNVGVKVWLENAVERFRGLNNPLRLLFLGNGLPTLASMYSNAGEIGSQVVTTLECTRSSWVYCNLGSYLYSRLSSFDMSSGLLDRLTFSGLRTFSGDVGLFNRMIGLGYTSGDIVRWSPQYMKMWDSLFCPRDGLPDVQSTISPLWAELRAEMRSFLKSQSVDLFNASTFACADLLDKGCVLPVKPAVRFCLVNRPRTTDKSEAKVSSPALEASKRRKLEREFRRQFGKWPRGLKKVVLPS